MPPPVPDIAFAWNFHQMSARDMADVVNTKTKERPVVRFKELQPGTTYLYRQYERAGHYAVYEIVRMTPSGSQATGKRFPKWEEERMYRGAFTGPFRELTPELISLLSFDHQDVVEAAVVRGYEVPVAVRVYYPQFFVEVPEEFAKRSKPAHERVRDCLTTWWNLDGPCTVAKVDAWIEEAHREAAGHTCMATRAKIAGANPDYQRFAAEYRQDVLFYRWLRPHVDVGGIFYMPTKPAEEQPAEEVPDAAAA